MKTVLICPAERPAVSDLAEVWPLVLAPLLGRSVLEFWIESLALRGVTELIVFAADRPSRVRDAVGDGRRWGVAIDVLPSPHEVTPSEARRRVEAAGQSAGDIIVLDHLPDHPDLPLFDSYASWFAAQRAAMRHAAGPARIGVRERSPGVFVGLRAEIDPSATLEAPCWIGDYARIGPHATIGPGALIDSRVVVSEGARIVESAIGPDTLVGKYVSVEGSLAYGRLLLNQRLSSAVRVPDPFLLDDLGERRPDAHRTTLIGRIAALIAMLVTIPFAVGVVLLALMRGYAPWHLRLALRSGTNGGRPSDTFAYYELTGSHNWLRRWPQFWSIVQGEMAWTGNRPLRPTQALALVNDFERLWLDAPVGLISLADAHGCPDGISDEAVAHSTYYAVHANWRLDAFILWRSLLGAVLVWPILGYRRKDATVPLQNLATRPEL